MSGDISKLANEIIELSETGMAPAEIDDELRATHPDLSVTVLAKAYRLAGERSRAQAKGLERVLSVAKRGGLKKGEPIGPVLRRMAAEGDKDAANIVASWSKRP